MKPTYLRNVFYRIQSLLILMVVFFLGCSSDGSLPPTSTNHDISSTTSGTSSTSTATSGTSSTIDGEYSLNCPNLGPLTDFVTAEGAELLLNGSTFRFISINVPNLHMNEDPEWHVPDPWEQADALCSVAQMGGRVARTYTISVGESGVEVPRHVTAPGVFSEELFVALDHAISAAHDNGIRLIIPFVDQWSWWGGIAEYAEFQGENPEMFWTDPDIIEDFKATIEFTINRVNSISGIPYKDDPAILAWETGNELEAPDEWTAEIAAYVKSLDANHLLIDGHYGVTKSALNLKDVDIVSNHYYWPWPFMDDVAGAMESDLEFVDGQKPFIVGEYGLISTERVEEFLSASLSNEVAGSMIWSLRSHDSKGGFYWHTEIDDGDALYRSYHWPGFGSGDPYDETEVLALLHEYGHLIQDLEPAPPTELDPPTILDVSDDLKISWRGSTGAGSYNLYRSSDKKGPWSLSAAGLEDANVPNEATYSDDPTYIDKQVYYRLTASNQATESAPSLVFGPVNAPSSTSFIDTLDDMSLIYDHSMALTIDTQNTSYFQGDAARLTREENSEQYAIWMFDNDTLSFDATVWFWPSEGVFDPAFAVSADGSVFEQIHPFIEERDGDWIEVHYGVKTLPKGTRFIRVTFLNNNAISWNPQLGHLEVRVALD